MSQCSQRPSCPVCCDSPSVAPRRCHLQPLLWEQPSFPLIPAPASISIPRVSWQTIRALLWVPACTCPACHHQGTDWDVSREESQCFPCPRESSTSEGLPRTPSHQQRSISPRDTLPGSFKRVWLRKQSGKELELLFPPWPNVYVLGGCGIRSGR